MSHQQIQGELRVAGIVLGAADVEGLAVLRQRGRIDGEQHQKGIALQGIDQGPLASSRHTAIGAPPKRWRSSRPTGRWSRDDGASTLNSGVLEPAGSRHTSCLRSAQSMPTKAANSVVD